MTFIPTLLKYDFAVEAGATPLDKFEISHEHQKLSSTFHMCKGVNMKPPQYFNKDLEVKSLEKEKEDTRLADVLDFLFPPRRFLDNGKQWVQYVSKYLSNAFDLKGLEGELERMMLVRSARKKGLCHIRRQIYSQLMDELIRQITVECIDRGLLLNRIKKEMNHLFETYEILLQASFAFLARKSIEAKNQHSDRVAKVNNLVLEKKNLERQVSDLKLRVDQMDKRNQDLFKRQESKHGDEILYFKNEIQQYKAYIDSLLTGSQTLGT